MKKLFILGFVALTASAVSINSGIMHHKDGHERHGGEESRDHREEVRELVHLLLDHFNGIDGGDMIAAVDTLVNDNGAVDGYLTPPEFYALLDSLGGTDYSAEAKGDLFEKIDKIGGEDEEGLSTHEITEFIIHA